MLDMFGRDRLGRVRRDRLEHIRFEMVRLRSVLGPWVERIGRCRILVRGNYRIVIAYQVQTH
jgi:hypothetical protein